MLIEEQVVVAEMLPAHVPVEVLSLHVKCEHVGERFTKSIGYLRDSIATEIACRFGKVLHLGCGIAFHYAVFLLI